MSILLCSRLNFGELPEICYIRVVPSLTLGPVWLFLVVANRADLTVLAQDLGEMRGICLVRGQFLLLAGPGKTSLPVRIARNLRHSRLLLANGAKFAQFASNSFCWLVQGRLLFLCGLHEICITRGYRWRMARNLLSLRAIPFICLQKTD